MLLKCMNSRQGTSEQSLTLEVKTDIRGRFGRTCNTNIKQLRRTTIKMNDLTFPGTAGSLKISGYA